MTIYDESDFSPSSPFVCKVSFYIPNKTNRIKNVAHIQYIGTRTGVDLGTPEISENNEFNNLDEISPDSPAGHVKYAHERPGSHGLFTANGIPNINDVKNELKEHQGIVYRMVLSLKEEDALRLNMGNRESWEKALRASVPMAASKMGIGETNLKWVAAFHEEKGHPHVHLVLWERDPQRRRGQLSNGEMRDIKREFIKVIYGNERVQLLQEKTAMRDLVRDLAKGDTEKALSIIKEIRDEEKQVQIDLQSIGTVKPGIAPKMFPDDIKQYAKELNELAAMMPGKGRAALNFMPYELKEKSRAIADQLMSSPAFKESVEKYLKAAETLTRQYTVDPLKIKYARDNAYMDLRDRVANIVIRGAAKLNRENRQLEFQNKKIAFEQMKDHAQVARSVWKSVWRGIEQARLQSEAEAEVKKRQLQMARERQNKERGD